jgi:hypothetical protein
VKVRVAYDAHGVPVGGRVNVPTYVCPHGHGWTVGFEDDARAILRADPLVAVAFRSSRPLIQVP